MRRLNEELGITGLDPQHRHHLEYRADVGGGLTEHEVVDVYVAKARDDLHVAAHPDEVMAVEWVRFGDLIKDTVARPERYTPWLRIYLAEHAETIFGDMAALQTS